MVVQIGKGLRSYYVKTERGNEIVRNRKMLSASGSFEEKKDEESMFDECDRRSTVDESDTGVLNIVRNEGAGYSNDYV